VIAAPNETTNRRPTLKAGHFHWMDLGYGGQDVRRDLLRIDVRQSSILVFQEARRRQA
jgi:hypothetical protein